MDKRIKNQVRFVLEGDNEVMTSVLDSDLDGQNKQMNRRLRTRPEISSEVIRSALGWIWP